MTGSSFPDLAMAVKSFPYFSSASYFPSGSVTDLLIFTKIIYEIELPETFNAYKQVILIPCMYTQGSSKALRWKNKE